MALIRAEAKAKDEFLVSLEERFPNYQNFTAVDFKKLPEGDLRTFMGMFGYKKETSGLIPDSFTRKYGEDAPGEFMLAVERAAAAQNVTTAFAKGTLNAGLGKVGKAPSGSVNSDVPVTVTYKGKTVQSTAPRVLNYAIAVEINALSQRNAAQDLTAKAPTTLSVSIPEEVVRAVVAANPHLPASLPETNLAITFGDEMAFMSGYATRMGAAKEFGPMQVHYQPESVCMIPQLSKDIFNAKKSNQDVDFAWAVGNIQADLDQMPKAKLDAMMSQCVKLNKTKFSR